MDLESRMDLIRGVGEEIITEPELRKLLQTNDRPVAYDGFEPSGLAHVPFGILRPMMIKDLQQAGVHVKLWLADWFAWINNKMDGNMERIRKVGEYFIEVWKAAGVTEVEYIFASDLMDKEYWRRVLMIAKNTTMNRATRALTIMGRTKGEMKEVAQYFYPMMQVSDIFQLDVDICQLGLDQRRAGMLARDVAPKLKLKKPVVVSHHMLMGLQGAKQPEGFEESRGMDMQISAKMSKSKPATCIFIHDSREEIRKKLMSAFCPEKITENNPVLEYFRYIIFRKFKAVKVDRARKSGGYHVFNSYEKLEESYRKGDIHPLDAKTAAASYMDDLIKPVREHFEKDKNAKALYEFVSKQDVTR